MIPSIISNITGEFMLRSILDNVCVDTECTATKLEYFNIATNDPLSIHHELAVSLTEENEKVLEYVSSMCEKVTFTTLRQLIDLHECDSVLYVGSYVLWRMKPVFDQFLRPTDDFVLYKNGFLGYIRVGDKTVRVFTDAMLPEPDRFLQLSILSFAEIAGRFNRKLRVDNPPNNSLKIFRDTYFEFLPNAAKHVSFKIRGIPYAINSID